MVLKKTEEGKRKDKDYCYLHKYITQKHTFPQFL